MQSDIIVDVKLIKDSENAIKAKAEVSFQTEFGELNIAQFKVIVQDVTKPAWVAWPDIRYKDDKGEFRSIKVLIPSRRFKKIVDNAIIEKYAEEFAYAQQK